MMRRLWHAVFGHLDPKYIREVRVLQLDPDDVVVLCLQERPARSESLEAARELSDALPHRNKVLVQDGGVDIGQIKRARDGKHPAALPPSDPSINVRMG